MKKKVSAFFLGVSTLALVAVPVNAQNLLPSGLKSIFDLFGRDGTGVASFARDRITLALTLALGLIILVAVVYSLIAAFKYIQSQGDPGKIEEAQKAIKAIFMGIAAMLIGIVGVVLVYVFFGASGGDASLYQTCISQPGSVGCKSCQQAGSYMEENPDAASSGTVPFTKKVAPDAPPADLDAETDICITCETLYELGNPIPAGSNCLE